MMNYKIIMGQNTNKLKIGVLSICLFVLANNTVKAQEVEKITLAQAVERTLANNLQIKQAQYQVSISDENVLQSKYSLYPNATASLLANRQFGFFFNQNLGQFSNGSVDQLSARSSSSILLFGGGTLINQIKQNKELLSADKTNIEKIKNDLSLTVVNTYLQILNNQDLIKASLQQLELSKQQLSVAQKQFDVGNNTQADLSQAKAQVATNELNLTNAQNAYELSILDLKQLMEMSQNQAISVEVPLIDAPENIENKYTASDVYNKALEINPEIKLAIYNTKAFKYGIDIAKGSLYPSLSFSGGLTTNFSNNITNFSFIDQITDRNFGQSLGFNLSIPIFNNYRNRSSLNIAKIRFENAKVSEQLAKNNLNKIINQATQDLKSAIKSYSATKSAFESSKEAFNVIKQRYEVGLINGIELNTSQTNYNKAQFDLIQAKYNVIFRQKVIDFYLGNPLTL